LLPHQQQLTCSKAATVLLDGARWRMHTLRHLLLQQLLHQQLAAACKCRCSCISCERCSKALSGWRLPLLAQHAALTAAAQQASVRFAQQQSTTASMLRHLQLAKQQQQQQRLVMSQASCGTLAVGAAGRMLHLLLHAPFLRMSMLLLLLHAPAQQQDRRRMHHTLSMMMKKTKMHLQLQH
jgi:hypothetical protein